MAQALEIRILGGVFALARLPREFSVPATTSGAFSATLVSEHGVTLVCQEEFAPAEAELSAGFRCLTVASVFELESVGIVAAVTQSIAEAGISLFAYSTWETDYILVQERDLPAAVQALAGAGHRVIDTWRDLGAAVNPGSAARP